MFSKFSSGIHDEFRTRCRGTNSLGITKFPFQLLQETNLAQPSCSIEVNGIPARQIFNILGVLSLSYLNPSDSLEI